MATKLHRCSLTWFKMDIHPCWRVQKELDGQGVDYEIVKGPALKGQRNDLEALSGQRKYPVIEFESGAVYREESRDMAATVASGNLAAKDTPATPV